MRCLCIVNGMARRCELALDRWITGVVGMGVDSYTW